MYVRLIVTATTHDRDTTVRKWLNISKQADKRWPDLITLPPYSPITVTLIYPDGGVFDAQKVTSCDSRDFLADLSNQKRGGKEKGSSRDAVQVPRAHRLAMCGFP